MIKNNFKNNKLGAFIVPTGIGASIGGYAGDASTWARRFAQHAAMIVNPNVVNAGAFSGITTNMLYVEGYSLDEFFKGKVNLQPSIKNKIGVIFDKGISQNVLNIHLNTINAVKTVYDIDIIYEITPEAVEVIFFVDNSGISTGKVKNIETLLCTAKNLLQKGANAIAVVCKFNEDNQQNQEYENGLGVDPIGGVEAIISHYLSKELKIPVAHAPAFEDFSISTKIIDPKSSAEYITPTFLPCILIGLNQAPLISNSKNAIKIADLDFLVMPYNALGATPVFEAIKRRIKVFAVRENHSILNVTKKTLAIDNVIEVETYEKCLELVKKIPCKSIYC
ncbi:MAG: DUF3326 domain-containing protein [bacterium]